MVYLVSLQSFEIYANSFLIELMVLSRGQVVGGCIGYGNGCKAINTDDMLPLARVIYHGIETE